MPSLDLLLAFITATAIFAYMPGPSTLYAAAQTLARGRRAGWMAALGIHLGGYAHVIAAAAGLSILFEAVPLLYSAVKLAGAAYLVWLGVKLIRAKGTGESEQVAQVDPNAKRAFWESVTVEVLNPKTAIFYLAFLPQFADATASLPIWGQLLLLGTIVNIMFSSADVLCVLLAAQITAWLKRSAKGTHLFQKLGGGILVLLGIHLALSRQ